MARTGFTSGGGETTRPDDEDGESSDSTSDRAGDPGITPGDPSFDDGGGSSDPSDPVDSTDPSPGRDDDTGLTRGDDSFDRDDGSSSSGSGSESGGSSGGLDRDSGVTRGDSSDAPDRRADRDEARRRMDEPTADMPRDTGLTRSDPSFDGDARRPFPDQPTRPVGPGFDPGETDPYRIYRSRLESDAEETVAATSGLDVADVEVTIPDRQTIEQRERAADNLPDGYSPYQVGVGLTDDAEERLFREQLEEEYPDAEEINLSRDDGELIAEIRRPEEGASPREAIETIATAPFEAQQAAWQGIASAIDNPRKTAETVGTAPFDAQQAAWKGVADVIDNPRETAGDVRDLGEAAAEQTAEAIVDPIDMSGFSADDPVQSLQELDRRIQESVGYLEDTSREEAIDAVQTIATAPVTAQQAAWEGIATAIDNPRETAESVATAPFDIQQDAWMDGAEVIDATRESADKFLDEARDSREAQALAAAAPIAAAEPTPAGEVALTAAGVVVGAGIAADIVDQQQSDSELVEEEFGRPEISVPAEPVADVSEIEPQEAPEDISEIDVPTGPADVQTEIETPADPDETSPVEAPIETSPITIGEEIGRGDEESEDEDEDDVRTITEEDLYDPDKLREEELEELGRQVEEQAQYTESGGEFLENPADPLWTPDRRETVDETGDDVVEIDETDLSEGRESVVGRTPGVVDRPLTGLIPDTETDVRPIESERADADLALETEFDYIDETSAQERTTDIEQLEAGIVESFDFGYGSVTRGIRPRRLRLPDIEGGVSEDDVFEPMFDDELVDTGIADVEDLVNDEFGEIDEGIGKDLESLDDVVDEIVD